MNKWGYERDLKFDLLAAQRRRAGQLRNLLKSTSELRCSFDQRRALQRSLSRFAPQARGLIDQPSLGAMMRQQLRLALGDLGELAFKGFGDTGVKRASWLAQQRAIGRVLHQGMLEQVGRMRRHALPEQQAGLMRRSSADPSSASGLRTTKASRAWENSRPIAAPICATSLAGPSRSSRAISDACKLAGTARAGDGTAATVRRAAPSLSASSTAFVISSTNRGMPSVRSTISAITSRR